MYIISSEWNKAPYPFDTVHRVQSVAVEGEIGSGGRVEIQFRTRTVCGEWVTNDLLHGIRPEGEFCTHCAAKP